MTSPGEIHFRSPDGEHDAAALAAVQAARAEQDAVDPLSTLESLPDHAAMRSALAEAAAAGQLDRWRVAEAGGQVVGYGNLSSWHEEDGRWVYLIQGWVRPDWRGQGIGTDLLRWGEARVRRLAPAEHPGEAFEFAGQASSTEPDAAALLAQHGYVLGYTDLEMDLDPAAPLPEVSLPPGLEARPALPAHIPLIAASIAEAYRGEFPGNRYRKTHSETAGQAEWYSRPVHDRSLWQVAWEADQVAGQVLPLIEHGRAVIDEASVRPAWRRRGLARALLTRALRELRAGGVTVVRLGTCAEFRTRAKDLYASVGFRVVKSFGQYRKSPA